MKNKTTLLRRLLLLFIVCLALSGITAIPVETELTILARFISPDTWIGEWLHKVNTGMVNTNRDYPFLAYGYDWLAFAHIVLAVLFIGVLRDPVRNRWVVEFGMIACVLVLPFAFIAGHFRGIPIGWRFIDCLFGIFGFLLLGKCLRLINTIEKINKSISGETVRWKKIELSESSYS